MMERESTGDDDRVAGTVTVKSPIPPIPQAFGPSRNPHAPPNMVAFRSEADATNLSKLVGRIVQKYFSGYGTFLGKVIRKVPERPVVEINYEDGDEEELYLDQVYDALMPLDTLPMRTDRDPDSNDKFGYVWPPPTTSARLLVDTVRKRQPSAFAQQQQARKQQLKLEAEEWKAQRARAREERERRRVEKAEVEHRKAQERLAKAEAMRKKKEDALKAREQMKLEKLKRAKLKEKQNMNLKTVQKKDSSSHKTKKTALLSSSKRSTKANGHKSGIGMDKARSQTAVDLDENGSTGTRTERGSKRPSKNNHTVSHRVGKRSKKDDTRKWVRCSTCPGKHWSDSDCTFCFPDDELLAQYSSLANKSHTWNGNSTAALLVSLREQVHVDIPNQENEDGQPTNQNDVQNSLGLLLNVAKTCALGLIPKSINHDTKPYCAPSTVEEQKAVTDVYQAIKAKVDITCGGDGYGMTGNVTKASMQRLFDVLRDRFGFNEASRFIDLGHGMGRPTMHAAVLSPPIAASFGTEFNPQLYKQSMLALQECAQLIPSLQETPRVFFMDQNIKDMTSLEPFSHVYTFQIGMPEDVVSHVFNLITTSPSVQYAIIYPHRSVTTKRLQSLGDIVHSQSMSMPGGCSYEVNVVKVSHNQSASEAPSDTGISNAMEVLADRRLYDKYLEQLGTVSVLEYEQFKSRQSRRSRRSTANTRFLEQSPCIPDINYGFLRRVAVALGVGTSGGKVQILSNIQLYCPVTFGLSMFAVGDNYTDEYLQKVVDRLLAAPPSHRQPEAMHN